jgi:hypothetical protein
VDVPRERVYDLSTGRHLDPMDLVTKNLVSSFKDEESLPSGTDDATVFEHFANFCVVSQDYGEEFDVDDVHTGGGDDLGMDGLAIIVNGAMVSDPTEVEDLAAEPPCPDVLRNNRKMAKRS